MRFMLGGEVPGFCFQSSVGCREEGLGPERPWWRSPQPSRQSLVGLGAAGLARGAV